MFANACIHTVNLQQPVPYKGTSGGEKVNWTTVQTAMPCRVIDTAATWKVFYAQRNIEVTHTVLTNQSPMAKAGWQLVWGTRVLRIIAVYDKGGANNLTQLDCSELLGG